MNHETYSILLGGALLADDRARALASGSRAIAADGGIQHAEALGLTPDLWVGDFDSVRLEDIARWKDVPRQDFPPAKNETDGELAVNEAIARGAKKLILFGALEGERTDHALLHMLFAIALAERGLDIVLSSGHEEARPLISGSITIDLPEGSLFSVLPFSDLEGLHYAGARYPLDGSVIDFVPFGGSRGVSNVAEGPVTVTIESGKALVIARPSDLSGV